jgi:prepilin-type N-terminal cleavage/methylation domain-containing protein
MKFMLSKNSTRGFTLIELLVVIAIIGILSSVVLASLSTARQKSRDAKRISDIGQIQLAAELFFDATSSYPTTAQGISSLYTQKFLPQIPNPPSGSAAAYIYYGSTGVVASGIFMTECTTAPCVSYSAGIDVERTDNTTLASDADQGITNATTFNGPGDNATAGQACKTATGGGALLEKCYDIKP